MPSRSLDKTGSVGPVFDVSPHTRDHGPLRRQPGSGGADPLVDRGAVGTVTSDPAVPPRSTGLTSAVANVSEVGSRVCRTALKPP